MHTRTATPSDSRRGERASEVLCARWRRVAERLGHTRRLSPLQDCRVKFETPSRGRHQGVESFSTMSRRASTLEQVSQRAWSSLMLSW